LSSNNSPDPEIRSHRIHWILVGVFCLFVFILRSYDLTHNPITWDEPVYLHAAQSYVTWIKLCASDLLHGKFTEPFSVSVINQYWQRHLPSPPLAKTINGITWMLFRKLLGDLAALRTGTVLCYVLLFVAVIIHARLLSGWIAAAIAALTLFVNPRLFFHAGTANLDAIGMIASYIALFYFWRTAEFRGWRYLTIAGILWGMAFSAKNSALLVLPAMVIWAVICIRKKYLIGRLIGMQLVAALTFFLLWPWLFHDTAKHLDEFAQFAGLKSTWQHYTSFITPENEGESEANRKLTRDFGSYATGLALEGKQREFPWHSSIAVLFTVVPAPTLILFAIGTGLLLYNIRNPDCSFLLLGMWIPVLITSLPSSPIYDMERFLLICFPFMALTAGYAVARLLPRVRQTKVAAAVIALIVTSFTPAVLEWRYVHPLELSYYNEFIGGLRGAVQRGFPATYWLQGYSGALPYMNKNLPDGVSIAAEEERVLATYQEFGMLKQSLQPDRMLEKAKVAERIDYFIHQRPMSPKREELLDEVYSVKLHDVPIVTLYKITPEFVANVRHKENKKAKRKAADDAKIPYTQ